MSQEQFANNMVALGREHGFILGMKRATEILRAHGIEVAHPARMQIFHEMQHCDRASVQAYADGALNANRAA